MSHGPWTDEENDLIVADYFAMLADDIAGRPYRKSEHNQRMQEKRRFAAAGFDGFSGHSLRAGFLTSAMEHGADTFRAADQGRWRRLETVREYGRRAKLFRDHAGGGFL